MLSSQKMSMVGAMTAGLSHEIMQPLQIILSTAINVWFFQYIFTIWESFNSCIINFITI